MLVQDTWLTLVSGREISQHGLPSVDALTVWARGSTWIDQQWLAQLLFFWTHELGGIKLVALAHVAAIIDSDRFRHRCGEVARCVVARRVPRRCPGHLRRTLGVPGARADLRDPLVRLARVAARRRQPRAVSASSPRLSAPRRLGEPPRNRRPGRSDSLPCAAMTLVGRGASARKPVKRVAPARPRADARARSRVSLASPYGLDLVTYYRTMLVELDAQDVRRRVGPDDAVASRRSVFFVLAFLTVGLIARFGIA